MMPRPKNKAEKIFYSILGKPSNACKKKTGKKKGLKRSLPEKTFR